jgi:hypothetical protein
VEDKGSWKKRGQTGYGKKTDWAKARARERFENISKFPGFRFI